MMMGLKASGAIDPGSASNSLLSRSNTVKTALRKKDKPAVPSDSVVGSQELDKEMSLKAISLVENY